MSHHNSINVHGVTHVEYGAIEEMYNGGVPFYSRSLRIKDEVGNTFTVNMFSDKPDGTVLVASHLEEDTGKRARPGLAPNRW